MVTLKNYFSIFLWGGGEAMRVGGEGRVVASPEKPFANDPASSRLRFDFAVNFFTTGAASGAGAC